MEQNRVKRIFEEKKELYINNTSPKTKPTVFILGGQPSSGKSKLNQIAETELGLPLDIIINGDNYRIHHPLYEELKKNPITFSSETQIFSNVFTEGLMAEAINNRLTVSVEGTMRRSEVVENTAHQFKEAGFKVELMCISAPPEFTAINLFSRYASEVQLTGNGRLADFESHNQACTGLLNTLDKAYLNKDIDRIRVYEIFGTSLIADYHREENGQWSIQEKPSEIVARSRDKQLQNTDLVFLMIDKGLTALSIIQEEEIKINLIKQIQNLITITSSIKPTKEITTSPQEDELLDEIDRLTYSVDKFKRYGLDRLWSDCKLYNSNQIFDKERRSTGQITISQAFKMALDNTPIKTSKVTLDAIQSEDTTRLRVNGITIDERLSQDNSRTIGRKR